MSTELKDYYKELSMPFPPEAMTSDTSRGFSLTSIKAQYVRERLNEVMGADGWSSNSEVVRIDEDGSVAVKYSLTMHFPQRSVTRTSFGGAKKKTKGQTHGDTYKSAETDALSKAASNFGVGNDVFKGLVDLKSTSYKAKPTGVTKNETPGGTAKSKSTFNRRSSTNTEEVSTQDMPVGDDI